MLMACTMNNGDVARLCYNMFTEVYICKYKEQPCEICFVVQMPMNMSRHFNAEKSQ